ncbi:MAG: GNAT family N-acetyltransferase [Verrucomicrobia bacterium]|nr:GNAT family N-acetyltransferase [Verrucomicrobiota bacterium]
MAILLSDDITTVDWNHLAVVFERAPLGKRDPVILRETFLNSGVRCFALENGSLVGAGRAITDWVNYAVILDVVVLPEYQGQGTGKRIMKFLAERSKAKHVLLHSVPGKERFYEKLGYRRMKTAMGLFADPETKRQQGYIE